MVSNRNNFWFSSNLQGNTYNRWPFSNRAGYETDLAGSITAEDYGENFKNIKENGNLDNILTDERVSFAKGAFSPAILPAFRLVNAGFTANRIMGKEWDKQINEHAGYQLERRNRIASPLATTEREWRELGRNEPFTTVSDFSEIMTAQRIAEDPALVDFLMTREEIENAGYKLSNLAVPIAQVNGTDYFDISMAYESEKGKNQAPRLALNSKTDTRFDISNLETDYSFELTISRISKALGVSIVPDYNLEKGKVEVKVGRIRSAGRQVVNYFRSKFNNQRKVVPVSAKIMYSTKGSKEEQLYSIIKQVARLTTEPYIKRVKKTIASGNGYNLPSTVEFVSKEDTLREFSASLIASEMVSMFLDNKQTAKSLKAFYRLDACQELAKLDDDNNWLIPLASGFVATSVNRCAGNIGYSASEYASDNSIKNTENRNFLSALFGKENYKNAFGLVSEKVMGTLKPIEKESPGPQPTPEPNLDGDYFDEDEGGIYQDDEEEHSDDEEEFNDDCFDEEEDTSDDKERDEDGEFDEDEDKIDKDRLEDDVFDDEEYFDGGEKEKEKRDSEKESFGGKKSSKYHNWRALHKYLDDETFSFSIPANATEKDIEKFNDTFDKEYSDVYNYVQNAVEDIMDKKFESMTNACERQREKVDEAKAKHQGTSREYLITKAEEKLSKLENERDEFATLKTMVESDLDIYELAETNDNSAQMACDIHDIISDTTEYIISEAAHSKGFVIGEDVKVPSQLGGKQIAQKIIAYEYGLEGEKDGLKVFKKDMKSEIEKIFDGRFSEKEKDDDLGPTL